MAAVVAAFVVAAAETIAGYAGPSFVSGLFFKGAVIVYLPLTLGLACAFSLLSPSRGLDLWFPLALGVFRAIGAISSAPPAGALKALVFLGVALVALLAIRSWIEPADRFPSLLLSLTFGIAPPILLAGAAQAFSSQLGERVAVVSGIVAGLLMFILLRAIMARWPRTGLLFLIVSAAGLIAWAKPPDGPANATPLAHRRTVSKPRPDILLVVLDTLRARSFTNHGDPGDVMPELNRFALGSSRFEHAWTNGSWTIPAHASLFSGLHPSRHRYDLGFDPRDRSSPDLFLAERLRRSGYATGAVVANVVLFGGEDRLLHGFESRDTEALRPLRFRPWFFDLIAKYPDAAWLRAEARRFPGPFVRAPAVVDRALAFWSRPDPRPRFLFVNFMETHRPYVPEPEDLGRYGPPGLSSERSQNELLDRHITLGTLAPSEIPVLRARYDEAARSLDRSLGRLLEGISGGPRDRETIVVITSDHGELLGEHGRLGHPGSLDEEVIRVPLVIRAPHLDAGANPAMVQLTDVFSFLCEKAGLEIETGLDVAALGERREAVVENRPGSQRGLADGYPRGDLSALIQWPHKYVEGPDVEPALFNLATDPGEHVNILAAEPARREAMRARLRALSGSASSPAAALDPAARERLRALGYVR